MPLSKFCIPASLKLKLEIWRANSW